MIAVQKSYQSVPAGLKSANAQSKTTKLMKEGSGRDADHNVYAHPSVKEALNGLYKNKCAYCESVIKEQADRRVDHYRPRAHYYWLSYEWSNLLLCCSTCNGKKGDKFPIDGSRVAEPPARSEDWHPRSQPMADEKPLLLNPEVDAPGEHLCFSADGQIYPINGSRRAARTIAVCQLNRESLALDRKGLIDRFRDDLKEQVFVILDQCEQGVYQTRQAFNAALELGFGTIVKQIKIAKDPACSYSLLGQLINQDPDQFLLASIPAGDPREVVRVALKRCGLIQ